MAITGGFGSTLDLVNGTGRSWYLDKHGAQRWYDNDQLVNGPKCDHCGKDDAMFDVNGLKFCNENCANKSETLHGDSSDE